MLTKILRQPSVTILIASLTTIVAFKINLQFPRPSVQELNNGHSSAFHDASTPDPLKLIQPDEAQSISVPEYTFHTNVTNPELASISFFYKCQPKCHTLWLTIDTPQTNPPVKFLLSHPLLNQLDWFHITDSGFHLYQQTPEYKSIEQLINEQTVDTILADKFFMDVTNISLPKSSLLDSAVELGSAKHIITTYQTPGKIGEWFRYSLKIDPRNAKLSSRGQLVWTLVHQPSNNEPQPKIWIARIQSQ